MKIYFKSTSISECYSTESTRHNTDTKFSDHGYPNPYHLENRWVKELSQSLATVTEQVHQLFETLNGILASELIFVAMGLQATSLFTTRRCLATIRRWLTSQIVDGSGFLWHLWPKFYHRRPRGIVSRVCFRPCSWKVYRVYSTIFCYQFARYNVKHLYVSCRIDRLRSEIGKYSYGLDRNKI